MNHFQPAVAPPAGGNSVHDLAGAVGRAIVDGDDFVVVVFESEQSDERASMLASSLQAGTMMLTRGSAGGSRSHSGRDDIGDLGHAYRGVGDDAESQASPRMQPAIQWK